MLLEGLHALSVPCPLTGPDSSFGGSAKRRRTLLVRRNKDAKTVQEDDEDPAAKRTLFCTNVALLKEQHIHDVFSAFAAVEEVAIRRVAKGKSTKSTAEIAFALVTFVDRSGLEAVFEKLESHEDGGGKKSKSKSKKASAAAAAPRPPLQLDVTYTTAAADESKDSKTQTLSLPTRARRELKASFYPNQTKMKATLTAFLKEYEEQECKREEAQKAAQDKPDDEGFVLVKNGFKPDVAAMEFGLPSVGNSSGGNNGETLQSRRSGMSSLLMLDAAVTGAGGGAATSGDASQGQQTGGDAVVDRKKKKGRHKSKTLEDFYKFQVAERQKQELLEFRKQQHEDDSLLARLAPAGSVKPAQPKKKRRIG